MNHCAVLGVGVEQDQETSRQNRFIRGLQLVRGLVSLQPWTFVVAVSGAGVYALCTAGSSLGVRWVIDRIIIPRFEEGSVAVSTVVAGCVLLSVISIVRAIGVVIRRTFAGKTEWGVAEKLTGAVAHHYARQPINWHATRSSGDLVARAGVDVEAAVAVLAPLPYGSSVVLMLIVSAIGLLWTDWVIGIIGLVVLPLLFAVNVVYQRRVDKHFDRAQNEMGKLSEAVLESFEGVTVVKAFGAEARETERLSTITSRLRDARINAVRARATFEMTLDAIPSLANLTVLFVGAIRVADGHLTVGELASVLYLFTLLVLPLRLIGYVFSEIPHSQAGWLRVREILDAPLAPDPENRIEAAGPGVAAKLSEVGVEYDGHRVLDRVSFEIARGCHTAIVGPTGSGKTTLLQVIAGIVPVTTGDIEVAPGGAAVVFQEPFIFSESVRHNVCLGREVSEHDVAEALRVADASFLLGLEQGLDTALGERGVSLSGGQRQRLALARALVRKAPLLLLDDTTSALDPNTEMRVLSNLKSSSLVDTIITVASRPSTISVAEKVIFLAGPGDMAAGTHAELMASRPDYKALIEAFDQDRNRAVSSVSSAAAGSVAARDDAAQHEKRESR